ncbi:ribosomal RNA Processing 5 isoform X2 [Tachypleus tridentatus]|uniref:ribosomal RNA Processing 5 isoform X2 n=1 Tax=Tachypleus tridentatus TaxID=6853 RepID=UPI003FD2456F
MCYVKSVQNFETMPIGEEINFPRGSSTKIVGHTVPLRKQDEDLFRVGKETKKSKKKLIKKKKKKEERKKMETENENIVVIEPLSLKTLQSDMVVLGCIQIVFDYEMQVNLPGGLKGIVPITNVSDPFTRLMEEYAANPESTEEMVLALKSMFVPGQTLPCRVMEISKAPETSRRNITLSVNPRDVNFDLNIGSLRHGMLVYVAVESVEDHGYVMDLGIKGLSAFLSHKVAASFVQSRNYGNPLSVGQLIPCIVDMPELRSNELLKQRIINLAAKPKMTESAHLNNSTNPTLQSIIPGISITVTVTKVLDEGLIVKLNCGYAGAIYKLHMKDVWELPKKYQINQEVIGTVLYIHPVTRVVYLSLLPKPNPQTYQTRFRNLQIGTVIEEAKVMSVEKSVVYFKLEDNIKGLAYKQDLSDSEIENIKDSFLVGSFHRCRVMGLNYLDGVIKLSLKRSVLERKYITNKELIPGAVFEGIVERHVYLGMLVRLSSNVRGFVRNLHISDVPVQHPEKMFPPKSKVTCQVLSADVGGYSPRLWLTCKKALISTKFPILSKYEDAHPDLIVEGTVVLATEKGLLVSFYNDIKGWVPARELSETWIEFVDKVFYVGQVVRCRVLTYSADEQRLTLSLKLQERKPFGIRDMSVPNVFEMGKILDVKVKAITEKGLDVQVVSTTKRAFLPVYHLSDHPKFCQLLLKCYRVGEKITDVLCFERKGLAIVSKKPLLVNGVKEGSLPCKLEDFEPEKIYFGVVNQFSSFGMFVDFPGDVRGLVPLRYMTNERIADPESSGFRLHQTIAAKVVLINVEKHQIDLSTKLSDCYFNDPESSVTILENYLNDWEKIRNNCEETGGKKAEIIRVKPGTVREVTVFQVTQLGVLCKLHNDIFGLATKNHLDGKDWKVEEKSEAVVLHADFVNNVIEISLSHSLVKLFKHVSASESSKVKVGQVIKCQAQLVKEDFVQVSLLGHAVGSLAYIPTRRHINDIRGRQELYTVGEYYHIVIKKIWGEYIIGVLKQHDKHVYCMKNKASEHTTDNKRKILDEENTIAKKIKLEEASSSEEAEMKNKKANTCLDAGDKFLAVYQKLNIGGIYPAKVQAVKKFQLNILINNKHTGRVHITEIADNVVEGTNPLEQFKVGDQLNVKVIGYHKVKPRRFLPITRQGGLRVSECSVRAVNSNSTHSVNSMFVIGQEVTGFVKEFTNSCLWLLLSPHVYGKVFILNLSNNPKVLREIPDRFLPSQAFKAIVINSEDDHTELVKLGVHKPDIGQVIMGQVVSARAIMGALVRLPYRYWGVVELTNLHDDYRPASSVLSSFLSQKFIRCYVLGVDHERKQCQLSTRASRLKKAEIIVDPEVKSISDLSKGQVLRGFVTSVKKRGVTLALGMGVRGTIPKKYFPDNLNIDLKSFLPLGSVLTVKVITINEMEEVILSYVDTSTSNSTKTEPVGDKIAVLQSQNERTVDVGSDTSSECSASEDLDKKEESQPAAAKRKKTRKFVKTVVPDQVRTTQDETHGDCPENGPVQRLQVSEGFVWDTEGPINLSSLIAKSADIFSSDSDEKEEKKEVRRRKTKKQKQEEEQNEEEELFKAERMLINEEREPESVEDFERLVLSSPNSSIVWLRYMAFHLQQAEIDKARTVAECALKTISFREEQEKLNVWSGFLNLENLYGTQESLMAVFQRALQQNEPMKIFVHLINIYMNSNKIEEVEQLYNTMIKRFRQNKEVWINFGTFYMKTERPELARKLMQRSLKSLDKRDHVDVISKFAQMEFKFGDAERGCTLFENILINYTKRTDLWSVYIDLMIKQGDIEAVRHIFERVTSLKLSAKKMKFFFKRYLDFEKQYGSEEMVNQVKQKALDYVESLS